MRKTWKKRKYIFNECLYKLDKTLFSLTYNFPSIYLVKNARTNEEVLKWTLRIDLFHLTRLGKTFASDLCGILQRLAFNLSFCKCPQSSPNVVTIFSMNCAHELTQTKMSCCSVAVELCIKFVIFAAHVNSLSVEVYGIPEFSFSVFPVAFLKVHFRYC